MPLPFDPPAFDTAVRADYHRVGGPSRFAWWRVILEALRNKTFAPVFTIRLCQYYSDRRTVWAALGFAGARGLHRWSCGRAGVELPWSLDLREGLLIVHGFGLVVNGGAVIGSNVTLCHGVTLGGRDTGAEGERTILLPSVGDDVYIGPGALILGCHVGAGSFVSPMSVVVQSVEPRSLITPPVAIVRRTDFRFEPINRWPGESTSGDGAPRPAFLQRPPATD
ncbi:serine acetyltransferase [Salinarimonas soli]|uniref:Serine acetyltransferase n=1 Tax=Salinarimonas soli TaxID=1638099 RepID=A0A5B2V7J9_9HYPH|nr:serine acetyltransferase [Salinarimonas soli]KAA2234786.1 serine acetyltransferase [Salinarimonas soli]